MLIIRDKVIKKKKLAAKKKAVLDILSMFEQINTDLNTIAQHIANKNFNEAVSLYKKQEEKLYNKLKGYCLSEKIEAKLNAIRSQMITDLNSYFKEEVSRYLTECFLFSKKKGDSTGDTSRLIQEMTLIAHSSMNMSMDISLLERFEQNSVPLYLLGNFEPTKKAEIEALSLVISNFLSIKDFKLENIEAEVTASIRGHVKEVKLDSSS